METYHGKRPDDRSEFQRDYDRLIFSAPFRRLQNKTQVFPLPGSVFVHNRLTHSLEVACVGRSLGVNIAHQLQKKQENPTFFIDEIGAIVSAACLAHDMGNPPFGHSGEKAIATYFSEGLGQSLQNEMTAEEWKDCICFEGNANAFRLLTHQFSGRRHGGFVLTYSTLASIVKYPYASVFSPEGKQKFGFFNSEQETFRQIANELGIPFNPTTNRYSRYPLVFLVEAADDICYQIMDIEDAHKLKILSTDETKALFLSFFDDERKKRIFETLTIVTDENEQIAYLRSAIIGKLINECTNVFVQNEDAILNGTFDTPLVKGMSGQTAEAYCNCSRVAVAKIYRSKDVLDVELAGYKIILTLLEHLVSAVLNPEKAYSKQLLMRIPEQYETNNESVYGKTQAILDYISGMTDVYALDLYRKITGMSIPTL